MLDPDADARLSQWGALALGLAHEIKNPLSTMTISLQLLKEDLRARSQVAAGTLLPRIEVMIDEVERLERIVNDFLRLAREPELAIKEKNPSSLIEEVLAFYSAEIQGKRVILTSQLDRRIASISIDPDLIKQALGNLIKNALQAMPEGGTLTIQSSTEENALRIEVIDTGQGVAPEILGRIFDAFFSTKPGGTGIGLALTRQIVQMHGGQISCESEFGFGTRFTLSLPLRRAEKGSGR